jgi:NADH pyrophosphatase NudC (nudix superfamily)
MLQSDDDYGTYSTGDLFGNQDDRVQHCTECDGETRHRVTMWGEECRNCGNMTKVKAGPDEG